MEERAESARDMSDKVLQCKETACASCPWRRSNAGKKAAKVEGEKFAWYSTANLRRLWSGIRRGERMTCHPTDSRQKQLNGKFVSPDVQTFECTGATILVQREMAIFQSDFGGDIKAYRRDRPNGITKACMVGLINRMLFLPLSAGLLRRERAGHSPRELNMKTKRKPSKRIKTAARGRVQPLVRRLRQQLRDANAKIKQLEGDRDLQAMSRFTQTWGL